MAQYLTISEDAFAEISVKKSRFIAGAYFCDSEEKAAQILGEIKKANKSANHNVYAYILQAMSKEKCSDDGEPAKTAGVPILDIIRGEGLSDVMVVVTRYFGGTLLGTGGLVRAYAQAARAALSCVQVVTVQEIVNISISIEYFLYEQVKRIIEQASAKIENEIFENNIKIDLICTLTSGAEISAKVNELSRAKAVINISQPYFARF